MYTFKAREPVSSLAKTSGMSFIAAQSANYAQKSGPYTSNTYKRRIEHTAQTNKKQEQSYILTLQTDAVHHKTMTSLRDRYFPSKLNKLSAHVALFRALPGSEMSRIQDDIAELVRSTQPFNITAKEPLRFNHGVGIGINGGQTQAKAIFNQLKGRWESFLSQQDRSFKAHYTIQNKVDDSAMIENTMEEVSKEFKGSSGRVVGLSLYLYDRGFWKKERDFAFEDPQTP